MLEIIKKINLLFSIIESIEIRNNIVRIKTNKDIIFENKGNTISISKGYKIDVASCIHLNPKITVDYDNDKEIDNIQTIMDNYTRQQMEITSLEIEELGYVENPIEDELSDIEPKENLDYKHKDCKDCPDK